MNTSIREPCTSLRLIVAEDHPVVREGLAMLLKRDGGFSVAAEVADGRALRTSLKGGVPDVLLMDLMLGNEDGLALIKDIVALHPALPILVFTLQPEATYAERCVRAGARGYVMKQEPVETLFAAVRTVASGGIFLSPRMAAVLLGNVSGAARKPAGAYAQLTDRELQVFRLLGAALSSREIAEKLGVSQKTIEAHRENIKNKLGADSSAALVARAAVWLQENGAG